MKDLIDQCFGEASAAEAPMVNDTCSHDMYGLENRKLREDVYGYRACFYMLLGLTVIWGVALLFNRNGPLQSELV